MPTWINKPDEGGNCCECQPQPCDDCCEHDVTVDSGGGTSSAPNGGSISITASGISGNPFKDDTLFVEAELCDPCPAGGVYAIHGEWSVRPLNSNKYPGDIGPGVIDISVTIGPFNWSDTFTGVDSTTVGGLFIGPDQTGSIDDEATLPFCDDDTLHVETEWTATANDDPGAPAHGDGSYNFTFSFIGEPP